MALSHHPTNHHTKDHPTVAATPRIGGPNHELKRPEQLPEIVNDGLTPS
jgi:hypothetical protein